MATRRISRSLGGSLSREPRPCIASTLPPLRPGSTQRRTLANVPHLTSEPRWLANGITNGRRKHPLFTASGFSEAWRINQTWLITTLNEMTAGDPELQSMAPRAIAQRYLRNQEHAYLFNVASQAHNNHFFFSALTDESHAAGLADFTQLHKRLTADFGSIDRLRSAMLGTARAMFGPGYVWLVYQRGQDSYVGQGKFSVLATYAAGTPYTMSKDNRLAQARMQGSDMNNTPVAAGRGGGGAASWHRANREQHEADMARQLGNPFVLEPVLCVSVWEHAYVPTWHVSNKAGYLDAWWDHIDWRKINERASLTQRDWANPRLSASLA